MRCSITGTVQQELLVSTTPCAPLWVCVSGPVKRRLQSKTMPVRTAAHRGWYNSYNCKHRSLFFTHCTEQIIESQWKQTPPNNIFVLYENISIAPILINETCRNKYICIYFFFFFSREKPLMWLKLMWFHLQIQKKETETSCYFSPVQYSVLISKSN